MSLSPGTTLGRYQILEPLGMGGMATVYKAYQPALERVVALKVIRQAFVEEEEFAVRFRREATAVARLHHPNIVQVFDFEEVEGRAFLAMQYLDGITLKDRLAEAHRAGGVLPPAETATIVEQVAAALSYAHGRGVIHRDVKPSNIMLTEERAVVTDFGVAKIVGSGGGTQTGIGIGTPDYMSPEQSQGSSVDARADIYSLGVMAYEMLVGRVPYVADTPLAVVLMHVRDPLPLPSTINPSVSGATELALLKALAKDPAQRHASATDFAKALSDAIATASEHGSVSGAISSAPAGVSAPAGMPAAQDAGDSRRPGPRSRPIVAAVGATALLVVAGAGVLVSKQSAETSAAASRSTGIAGPGAASSSSVAFSPAIGGAQVVGGFTPAPATPVPTPKFGIPAKGKLLYEAKLDGSRDPDISQFVGPAGAGTVQYRVGAVEVGLAGGGVSVGGGIPVSPLAEFVLEIELSAQPGSQLIFQWNLGQVRDSRDLYVFQIDAAREELSGFYVADKTAAQRQALFPAVKVAGVQRGQTITVATVASSRGIVVYVDQVQVGATADARASRAASPDFAVNATPQQSGGTLRILGMRVYALPA